jgi:hypothetical protein
MCTLPATIRTAALLALGALTLAGCGGPPAGGDPGGKRLEELAGDSVFATSPPRTKTSSVVKTKAAYTKPGFDGGGWRGPSIVVTFRSAMRPADVYRFYGARAAAAGWTPLAAGALRVTDRWTKTYPDGARATLSITAFGIPPAGTADTYFLSGGVAAAPS